MKREGRQKTILANISHMRALLQSSASNAFFAITCDIAAAEKTLRKSTLHHKCSWDGDCGFFDFTCQKRDSFPNFERCLKAGTFPNLVKNQSMERLRIFVLFVLATQKCGVPLYRTLLNDQRLWNNSSVDRSEQQQHEIESDFDFSFRMLAKADPMNKVVGGHTATPYSWPWMAALTYKGYFSCGAALVDPQFVVTAAHCFSKSRRARDYQIVLGLHDLRVKNFTVIRVSRIRPNPLFNVLFPRAYDIAVLKLERNVRFNAFVNAVCLPTVYANKDARCVVTGWGRLYEGGAHSDLLQELTVPVWDNAECNRYQIYPGLIHFSMLCAGYLEGGRDTCQGDSGGPLVCNVNGQWQLHGVVSWGVGCAKATKPGVYTRVMIDGDKKSLQSEERGRKYECDHVDPLPSTQNSTGNVGI
uniref:Peptidase S1 domain-containing protein n=1 Tax=Romanomermis culicivorax TaxID=13658 RepID=A0A915L618_ROMCU